MVVAMKKLDAIANQRRKELREINEVKNRMHGTVCALMERENIEAIDMGGTYIRLDTKVTSTKKMDSGSVGDALRNFAKQSAHTRAAMARSTNVDGKLQRAAEKKKPPTKLTKARRASRKRTQTAILRFQEMNKSKRARTDASSDRSS